MRAAMRVDGRWLLIGDRAIDLGAVRRVAVVGAGKAGAGMAAELEAILGDRLLDEKGVTGWVNVPDDCVRPLRRIHLHGARPAGRNEPTEAGVFGAEQILKLVESLSADDVCIALISGGGSALLPAPVEGVSLADKLALTRHLSAAGANIAELNAVRKPLSRIKGGGLARHCRAGRLISLIISDVPGDPLGVIASGPTVPERGSPAAALEVLARYGVLKAGIAPAAVEYLRDMATSSSTDEPIACEARNVVIGNNATAVDAAGKAAERLGYSPVLSAAGELEGPVEELGRRLVRTAMEMRDVVPDRGPVPNCLISGGEGTVELVTEQERGLGGRNQQLVLAALDELLRHDQRHARGIAILSGGTDGEDGPTDAAGAWLDESILAEVRQRGLNPAEFLRRNDAYRFFEPLAALLKTGPTHTNVCDVRVALVAQQD
jgi:hydroxypyruvate reductase